MVSITECCKAHFSWSLWIEFICKVFCREKNQAYQRVYVVLTWKVWRIFRWGTARKRWWRIILIWIVRKLVVIIEGTCCWLLSLVWTVLNLWHSPLVGNRSGICCSDYGGVLTQSSITGTRTSVLDDHTLWFCW